VLADLKEEPFMLESLQERETIVAKVNAAIAKRQKLEAEIVAEMKDAKKAVGFFKKVKKPTKNLPTMVGIESYEMYRNSKYSFMRANVQDMEGGDDREGMGGFAAIRSEVKQAIVKSGSLMKNDMEGRRKMNAENKKTKKLRKAEKKAKRMSQKESKKSSKSKDDAVVAGEDGSTNPMQQADV
jgi:hypothetical protein